MARRLPSRADRRDRFLVIGVLTMLLGLGLIGSSLAGPEPYPEVVAKRPYLPATAILPSTATSPLVVKEHVSRGLAPSRGHPLALRPANVVAPREDDPREYLSKMAELQRRHFAGQNRPPDPYQASLNPVLYDGDFTIAATPIAHAAAPHLQRMDILESLSVRAAAAMRVFLLRDQTRLRDIAPP